MALSPATITAASPLSEVNAQIARYGCNLPQYADSVPACRELQERARAIAGQRRTQYLPAPSYVAPVAPSPTPPRSGGGFFSNLFGLPSSPPNYSISPYSSGSPAPAWDNGGEMPQNRTFRTLCVRTCDGYYFPVSYSTIRSRFAQDEQICKASCQSDVKLFVHPNPGGEVEQAVTARGERYADLPNAFRYREQYVSDCRCKPDPWSEEARQIYAQRALGIDAEPKLAEAMATDGAGQGDARAPADSWAAAVSVQPALRRPETNHPAFRKNGFFSWLAGF